MKKVRDEVTGPWAISVRTTTQSITKVIPREDEDEDLYDILNRAKEIARAIKQKYSNKPDLIVEIISRSKAFPKPDKVKLGRGELWCPYCCKSRKFRKGLIISFDGITYASDEPRCIICLMSTRDYYVTDYNDLWPKDLTNIRARKGK